MNDVCHIFISCCEQPSFRGTSLLILSDLIVAGACSRYVPMRVQLVTSWCRLVGVCASACLHCMWHCFLFQLNSDLFPGAC